MKPKRRRGFLFRTFKKKFVIPTEVEVSLRSLRDFSATLEMGKWYKLVGEKNPQGLSWLRMRLNGATITQELLGNN